VSDVIYTIMERMIFDMPCQEFCGSFVSACVPESYVNTIRYEDFFMMGHQALISERGGGSDQVST